jgi:hypothetical protein
MTGTHKNFTSPDGESPFRRLLATRGEGAGKHPGEFHPVFNILRLANIGPDSLSARRLGEF